MKLFPTLLLSVVATITIGAEKDRRTPLEALHGDTMGHFVMCQLGLELARAGSDSSSADFRGCINEAKSKTAPALKHALASQSARPAVTKAIKAYYAAWLAAVRGIEPGRDELKITYSARQNQTEQRLNELWAAVEMEAGI